MLYENPKMEILKIEVPDVICMSVTDPPVEEGSDADGNWDV